MNAYEKIRAALMLAQDAGRIHILPGLVVASENALAALAELERAGAEPVAVTQEMCERVAASFYGVATFANGVEMNEALQLWQRELGPTLGMVVMREPTPEECDRIARESTVMMATSSTYEQIGRAMFRAVREVMGGEK